VLVFQSQYQAGSNTIYPRGLLSSGNYVVSLLDAAISYNSTGADIMSNGIGLNLADYDSEIIDIRM
jgi:hypothetical protein